MVKPYKRFQSQSPVKQNLTKHVLYSQWAEGGYPVQAEQPQSVTVLSLHFLSEIMERLFTIKDL